MAIQDPRAAASFSNFLEKYLREREEEWVDRKSPADTGSE